MHWSAGMNDLEALSTSIEDQDRALVARLIDRSGQPDLYRATLSLIKALLPIISAPDDDEDLAAQIQGWNERWDELEYLVVEHPSARGDKAE